MRRKPMELRGMCRILRSMTGEIDLDERRGTIVIATVQLYLGAELK